MAEPISLDSARERRSKAEGCVVCMACRHRWDAVAYAEGDWVSMPCPECGLNRGTFLNPFVPAGVDVFVCKCKSEAFTVVKIGIYCIGCGDFTSFKALCDD